MHQAVTFVDGMALKCGVSLQRLDIAHRTHGTLNAALPRVRPDADHSTGRLVATRVNVRPCAWARPRALSRITMAMQAATAP
jgi:hypothetical protein